MTSPAQRAGDRLVKNGYIPVRINDSEVAFVPQKLVLAAGDLLEACKAIAEFWDEREADDLELLLRPDDLIGGQPGACKPVTIRDVLRSAIAAATK